MGRFLNTDRGVLLDLDRLIIARKILGKTIQFNFEGGTHHDEVFKETIERDDYFEELIKMIIEMNRRP